MRTLLLRGVFLDGTGRDQLDIVCLDSQDDEHFAAKVLQWPEFLPAAPSDFTGYAGARLSPLIFLFIGGRQKVRDWRVMAGYALDLMKERHKDYSFLPLDMAVMRDDVPDEAYTALACFHRDLYLWNEQQEKEMEPAFIEQQVEDGQALLALLRVPRATGHYPGESLIRGNEADDDKRTAQRVIRHWLVEDVAVGSQD